MLFAKLCDFVIDNVGSIMGGHKKIIKWVSNLKFVNKCKQNIIIRAIGSVINHC